MLLLLGLISPHFVLFFLPNFFIFHCILIDLGLNFVLFVNFEKLPHFFLMLKGLGEIESIGDDF